MMDNDIVIKVKNLTKIYKLYDQHTDRFKEALHPFGKKFHKDFYALNDVSFEIRKGETFGIVGRNGSGKSTLLKIITGVLAPTSGEVFVKGKVASLLELGAGFNPEYTGLENIYFLGAITGFSRQEMEEKIEDVLSFADIGEFIYQPVKSYSSGMMVRLAFAVNVMMKPDILIIDEALSVGDALFQKKCFQYLEELISAGTTFLFVSHDQESIRTLTDRAMLLCNGAMKCIGTSSDAIFEYRKLLHEEEKIAIEKHMKQQMNKPIIKDKNLNNKKRADQLSFGDLDAEILDVKVYDANMEEKSVFYPLEKIIIKVKCQANKDLEKLCVGIRIRNKEGLKVYSWGTLNQDMAIIAGVSQGKLFWEYRFQADEVFAMKFEFDCTLGVNLYEIQVAILEEQTFDYMSQRILHWRDETAYFQVAMNNREYFYGGAFDLRMESELL